MDALGDVVCTLPMCAEIRERHPGCLLVFLTTEYCEGIVLLARAVDKVYSARSTRFKVDHSYFGLVEKIYDPQTTDERSDGGANAHLIDDLAGSCGLAPANRQPRLFPSAELVRDLRFKYGLDRQHDEGRIIFGINCGPTWKVREWDVAKWQALIDRIHAEYNAVILRFGTHISGKRNEYDDLTGVQSLVSCLKAEELAAVISDCSLIIAIDSGPIHIAGAVGVPVVSVFGAVNPGFRLPPSSPAVGLFSEVPCLFCHHKTPRGHWKHGCPYDIRCMKQLEVETVFESVKLMLAEQRGMVAGMKTGS